MIQPVTVTMEYTELAAIRAALVTARNFYTDSAKSLDGQGMAASADRFRLYGEEARSILAKLDVVRS